MDCKLCGKKKYDGTTAPDDSWCMGHFQYEWNTYIRDKVETIEEKIVDIDNTVASIADSVLTDVQKDLKP